MSDWVETILERFSKAAGGDPQALREYFRTGDLACLSEDYNPEGIESAISRRFKFLPPVSEWGEVEDRIFTLAEHYNFVGKIVDAARNRDYYLDRGMTSANGHPYPIYGPDEAAPVFLPVLSRMVDCGIDPVQIVKALPTYMNKLCADSKTFVLSQTAETFAAVLSEPEGAWASSGLVRNMYLHALVWPEEKERVLAWDKTHENLEGRDRVLYLLMWFERVPDFAFDRTKDLFLEHLSNADPILLTPIGQDLTVWGLHNVSVELTREAYVKSLSAFDHEHSWRGERALEHQISGSGGGAASLTCQGHKPPPEMIEMICVANLEHVSAGESNDRAQLLAAETLVYAADKGANHQSLIGNSLEKVVREGPYTEPRIKAIGLGMRVDVARFEPLVVELLGDKAKPIREEAAAVLGLESKNALEYGVAALNAKKAATREAAIFLLDTLETAEAYAALEDRLAIEKSKSVRSELLAALKDEWENAGRELTFAQLEPFIDDFAKRKNQPRMPAWIKPDPLPPLHDRDGKPLSSETLAFLLMRQRESNKPRPDLQAEVIYKIIDPASGADFALELGQRYLASDVLPQSKWTLVLAARLGDDRLAHLIATNILQRGQRGSGVNMAEAMVPCLALIGTDGALMHLQSISIALHGKRKKISAAADAAFKQAAVTRGITTDELGDCVVPRLGFDETGRRVLKGEGLKVEVTIGPDLKFRYRRLAPKPGKKTTKTLPADLGPEAKELMKKLRAEFRSMLKAQNTRLENLLVFQHRWTAARWQELYLKHPLLIPIASHILWGVFSDKKLAQTFRCQTDGSLLDASGAPVVLKTDNSIGLVHPLDLDDKSMAAWRAHFAEAKIVSPFPQLDRKIVLPPADQLDKDVVETVSGRSLFAMTLQGRVLRRGWNRGPVLAGQGFAFFIKRLPRARVDVILMVAEIMLLRLTREDRVELGDVYFVKHGSVGTHADEYDIPSSGEARVLSFGNVPRIVYSECMAELQEIVAG